jgi:hypothetical protein
MTSKIWGKVFSIIAEITACGCLYSAVMTLSFPMDRGESFLNSFRVIYGIVPALLSVGLPIAAGWLWSRSGAPESAEIYIKRAFVATVGAVVLFFVCVVVIGRLTGQIP